jgi:hypothetical protein
MRIISQKSTMDVESRVNDRNRVFRPIEPLVKKIEGNGVAQYFRRL